MMEVFVAKYDYERERDDVLSFKKGDKFEITHKPDDKWWAAKRIGDGCLGYVPALYLEPSKDRIVGRLIPEEVRKSEEHSVHLQALLELQKKVKPIPGIADSLGDDGEDDEDDDDLPFHLKFAPPDEAPPTPDYDLDEPYADTTPYHHKYHQHGDGPPVSPTGEEPYEGELVKPKPLPNPVRASKKHQELHRELKRVNRDGNREVLNQKPELTKAFEARRNAEKLKEIEESKKQKRTSLDIKLQKQQEKLREEEERQKQQTIEEDTKPEFMKVKLRHRADSDTGNGNKEGNGTS